MDFLMNRGQNTALLVLLFEIVMCNLAVAVWVAYERMFHSFFMEALFSCSEFPNNCFRREVLSDQFLQPRYDYRLGLSFPKHMPFTCLSMRAVSSTDVK